MTEKPTAIVDYVVDIVAVDPTGKVLLIERGWDPYKGSWALPGGYVDLGETSKIAAVRELEEETGVRVTEDDLRLIDVFDNPNRDPRGRVVSVAYAVSLPTGIEAAAGDDAVSIRWVSLKSAAAGEVDLAFDHHEVLKAAWQQRQ